MFEMGKLVKLSEFIPENPLEETLLSAKNGNYPISKLMRKIAESYLYVSSTTEVAQDGSGFHPLLVGDSKHPLVSAFSSISRTTLHREMAEFVLRMTGQDLFKRLPHGYGIALNPGYLPQLVISSDVIDKLKK
jgi:hypothetical protein